LIQKRLALLIGVSNYEYANSLKNPYNDVNSMDNVLSKLGFEVIKVNDPTLKDFKIALNNFGSDLNDYDVGLLYFAGHGIQVKGMNYLIPSDANPLNENQVEYDCINANRILSLMSDASNETNFMILDACRDNPFERSWHRSPTVQGLSGMSAPYGTLIAYSTAPDKTASDGEGKNGLYTSVLIDEIISPNLTILQVLQKVRSKLITRSGGQQVSWESTSLLKDFVFNDDRYVSISTFCQSVLYNQGQDLVLNNLKLNIWDLTKISQLNIPIRKENQNAGDIEIYYKNKLNYFDIFKELEIHVNKNGEREYSLFTTTKDVVRVYEIANEFYNKLGGGLYDDERASSFREFETIRNIGKGKAKAEKEKCVTWWVFENVTFILKYLNNPKRQFVLQIVIKPQKNIIQKSLKELIVTDYFSLLTTAIKIEAKGEDKGKFTDYHLSLSSPEFNIFDTVVIKKFNTPQTSKSSSNVFLTCSNPSSLTVSHISRLVAQITVIYGIDCNGEGYLTGYEENSIINAWYWPGRRWDVNIQHQIHDMGSAGEEMLYGIHLNYDAEIDGLELSIFGYESFLNYSYNEN